MSDLRQAPLAFPADLARSFIERENHGLVPGLLPAELWVRTGAAGIEGDDYKLLVQDRRNAKPVLAEIVEVAVHPYRFAVHRERSDAAVKGHYVDVFAVSDRRGRCERVERLLTRRFLPEHLPVPEDGPGLSVEAKQVKRSAFVSRRGHEDTISVDNRARPADAGDWRLPDNIGRLAPLRGQVLLIRDSLPSLPAKARPVLSHRCLKSNCGKCC